MTMNPSTISTLTPERRPISPIDLGESQNSNDLSFLAFGPEMFMTPRVTTYTAMSPPALCRDRKRIRRSVFEDENGKLYPQFLIPSLDEEDHLSREPFKMRLTQRLSHPAVLDEVKNQLLESQSTLPNVVTPIQSDRKTCGARRSLFRSPSYSEKSCDDSASNVIGIESIPRPKLLRRPSSTALTA